MIEILWTGSLFGQEVADDRVAHLVEGGDQPLLLRHHPGLLLGAGDHAHDPLLELVIVISRLPERAASSAASLTRLARSAPVKPGVWPASASRSISFASGLPRVWTSRICVRPSRSGRSTTTWRSKRPGPQQRRVEDVGPVGGGDQDDVVLHLEAVHLDQQLVQRLLALVVAAAHAGAAVAADGVDLVHEDDAGRVLLGLLEQVADAAGADADEHLDEVRAGDREERHAGLAGDRAGQQRLAGAGRAVQQHALGDARAERLELLGVLEELLDLVQLLDRLVDAGHVPEGDLGRVDRHPLGAGLAEAHHREPPPCTWFIRKIQNPKNRTNGRM